MQSTSNSKNTWLPYLLAFIGVAIFSLSFPMTKLALNEMNPYFVVSARTFIAGILGTIWLLPRMHIVKTNIPDIKIATLWQIVCVVIGFPILSSIALDSTGSSHSALIIAITPILTAITSSIYKNKKRSPAFWCLALATCLTIFISIISRKNISFHSADILLFIAAVMVALGYTLGAYSTALVGGTTAISLAVSATLPISTYGIIHFMPKVMPTISAIIGVLYIGIFSMFIGFIFWYEGLARGTTEHVSLVQSFQLFLTYIAGYFILNESLSITDLIPAILVAGFVIGSKIVK